MPEAKEQNYKNHAKLDPAFHFFMGPVAMISAVWAVVHAVREPSPVSLWLAVVGLAALVAVFKIRLYALKVQDRVIRLEERLRMTVLLPESLRPRISELTPSQLIALRFATDAELPAAVERTLAGNLKAKEIKQSLGDWRADHFRV